MRLCVCECVGWIPWSLGLFTCFSIDSKQRSQHVRRNIHCLCVCVRVQKNIYALRFLCIKLFEKLFFSSKKVQVSLKKLNCVIVYLIWITTINKRATIELSTIVLASVNRRCIVWVCLISSNESAWARSRAMNEFYRSVCYCSLLRMLTVWHRLVQL